MLRKNLALLIQTLFHNLFKNIQKLYNFARNKLICNAASKRTEKVLFRIVFDKYEVIIFNY